MTITIGAIYEDGVLKPSQPLPLSEREKVRVTVETLLHSEAERGESKTQAEHGGPSLAERIVARARALPPEALGSLPDDLAAEHDHYLYGTPKRAK